MKKLSLLTLGIITALSLSSCMMKSPEQIQAEKVEKDQMIHDIQSNKNWEIIYNTNNFSAIESPHPALSSAISSFDDTNSAIAMAVNTGPFAFVYVGFSALVGVGAKIATIVNDSPQERYKQFSDKIKNDNLENITVNFIQTIILSFKKNGYNVSTNTYEDLPSFVHEDRAIRAKFQDEGEQKDKPWDKTKNRLRISFYPSYYASSASSSYVMSIFTQLCIDYISSKNEEKTKCFFNKNFNHKAETFYSFNSMMENREKAYLLTKEYVEKNRRNLISSSALLYFDFFKDIK